MNDTQNPNFGEQQPQENTPMASGGAVPPSYRGPQQAPPQYTQPTPQYQQTAPQYPQYQQPGGGGNKNTLLYVIIGVLVVLLIGLVIFFAVGKKGSPEPQLTDTVSDSSVVAVDSSSTDSVPAAAAPAPQPAQPQANPDQYNQSLHLTGAIGKYGIAIDMDIIGGNITGSYYYTRYSSSNRLAIAGDYDPSSGRMHFFEYSDAGYTGEFDGYFNGVSFSGTMTNYKGRTYSTHFSKR